MHDILGGSNPSAQAMTGIVNNPEIKSLLPFAKPNGMVLPNQETSYDDIPFIIGLGGAITNVFQTGTGGTGPTLGLALQHLMFGTIIVFDDELTDGYEPGSGLIGKAQGFYAASSVDGNSQSITFTAMFKNRNYLDSISFFGVHRTGVSESHLAIMGGTGKYVNAKGYAKVKAVPLNNQQITYGWETVLEFSAYVTY
uniref:dirigent protein 25-like n=1 Tax=Erigeron canadensis TaxID=72917 RepID=UPI001CB8D153|nr:dirigent protein 25-like [Erigeron canadensis]